MKISSLRKFILEDVFFCLGFFLSLLISLKKISGSLFLVSTALLSFLILSVIFEVVFSKVDFFKRNLSRFLTCLLLFVSATFAFLMPSITSLTDHIHSASDVGYKRILSILAAETEVVGFLVIVIFIDSLIFSLRYISFTHIEKVYKTLINKVLCLKPKKNILFLIAFFYFIPLLVSLALLLLFDKFYLTIYPFLISIFASLFSICLLARNPITLREQKRLDIYLFELGKADSSLLLASRYKERIINRYVKPYSLPLASECIMGICRFFLAMKVKGKENIDPCHLPSVFVANHGEIIGPVCGTSYFPTVFRPYVHDHMCDLEKCTTRMWKYTFKRFMGFLGEEKGLKFSRFVAKIITHLINFFEPIHSYVSENDPRKSMQSMFDGLEALLDGDSMLIFPENPSKSATGHYAVGEMGSLYTGFAHIGKLYNDKTKRNLYFYPMFINKKKKIITIGAPVIFGRTDNVVAEKKRVAEEIQRRMNESK